VADRSDGLHRRQETAYLSLATLPFKLLFRKKKKKKGKERGGGGREGGAGDPSPNSHCPPSKILMQFASPLSNHRD